MLFGRYNMSVVWAPGKLRPLKSGLIPNTQASPGVGTSVASPPKHESLGPRLRLRRMQGVGLSG